MKTTGRDRRRFLKEAALAGLAVGAARSASGQEHETSAAHPNDAWTYGERSPHVNSLRVSEGTSPDPFGRVHGYLTPLRDSIGIITPASLHYATAHGYKPPQFDPAQYRLMIHGMVDRPLMYTLDELMRFPSITRIYFLECQANSRSQNGRRVKKETIAQTHGRAGCSEWTGVPLSLLLKKAGVRSGANWIVAEGAEAAKHAKSLPMAKAMQDVLIAYGQNGEPIRPEHGYPVKLLVPGFEGIYSVKWLRRVKVVDQPQVAFQEISRYTNPNRKSAMFNFEMGPKSVITRPSGGEKLPGRGFYEISGLAWSGGGVIRKIEVSTDGGRTWKEAQIQSSTLPMAFTRFGFGWNWDGAECEIQSRCTDELGQVQPTLAEFGRFWDLSTESLLSESGGFGHFNVIQPWRVAGDGSVRNGFLS